MAVTGPTTSNFVTANALITADRVRLTALEAKKVIIPISATYTSGSTWNATSSEITTYVADTVIMLILNQNNAGTILLQINALTATQLVKMNAAGTAAVSLIANDLVKNHPYFFKYESAVTGGTWVWISPTSADQINVAGSTGNVVTVTSGNVLSGSTAANTFISTTIHDNTLTPAKTTPVDVDEFVITSAANSYALRKTLWSEIKTTLVTSLGAMFLTASAQSPVGADTIVYAYNADSTTKKSTFTTLFGTFGTLLAASTAKVALAAATDLVMIADSGAANATRKMTLSDIFSVISNLTTKTSVVNADIIPIADNAAGTAFNSAKITIANFVASLKTLIATDTLAAPTDITTNNVSTSAHGFAPKLLFASQKYSTPWITIQKTADESVTSSAVLQNDDALVFTMAASTKYAIRGKIFFDTGATEDFKFRFNNTGSATLTRGIISWIVPGTTTLVPSVETAFPTTTNSVVGTGSTGGYIDVMFVVHNNTSGNFVFQWAQNTSSATATTTLAGSFLEYQVTQ